MRMRVQPWGATLVGQRLCGDKSLSVQGAAARVPAPAASLALRLAVSQPLGQRDDRNAEADKQHLGRAGARIGTAMQAGDESGDRNIEEPGGGEGENVRERTERLAQAEVRCDRPDH